MLGILSEQRMLIWNACSFGASFITELSTVTEEVTQLSFTMDSFNETVCDDEENKKIISGKLIQSPFTARVFIGSLNNNEL